MVVVVVVLAVAGTGIVFVEDVDWGFSVARRCIARDTRLLEKTFSRDISGLGNSVRNPNVDVSS